MTVPAIRITVTNMFSEEHDPPAEAARPIPLVNDTEVLHTPTADPMNDIEVARDTDVEQIADAAHAPVIPVAKDPFVLAPALVSCLSNVGVRVAMTEQLQKATALIRS